MGWWISYKSLQATKMCLFVLLAFLAKTVRFTQGLVWWEGSVRSHLPPLVHNVIYTSTVLPAGPAAAFWFRDFSKRILSCCEELKVILASREACDSEYNKHFALAPSFWLEPWDASVDSVSSLWWGMKVFLMRFVPFLGGGAIQSQCIEGFQQWTVTQVCTLKTAASCAK